MNAPQNAAVICQHCATEIAFQKPTALPSIISLECLKCGRRKVYKSEDVHSFKPNE